jgi:predicted signal transduction protein with EAL and GGDEF domain
VNNAGVTHAITQPLSTGVSLDAAALHSEWLTNFVDEIPSGVALFDGELRYVAANPAWTAAFGLAAGSLPGLRHAEIDPAGAARLAEFQRRALLGESVEGCHAVEGSAYGPLRRRVVSFRPRRARDGAVVGIAATLHEIVSAPADHAADLTDRLTGIAGRGAFLGRLDTALAPAEPTDNGSAIFLLDIADFKAINDLYGTSAGDQVLKTIATRLLSGIRAPSQLAGRGDPHGGGRPAEGDLVARLGADEFAIVLGDVLSPADAEGFARRLLQLVTAPVLVGEQRIRLNANIGFVTTGVAHRSADDVLRDLNVALEEAKTRGPNSAKAWEPALANTIGRRLAVLDELRRALDEGEFVLHYQPILSLADQRVVGAEALLRWNHPSEGLVPPGEFLPLLEESGLIVPVGSWVIREVVRQMQVWQMLYGRDMLEWVSVNVSARQFNDPSLVLTTLNDINDSGFPLDRLKIEITESAVMRNPEITRAVLGELQDVGIRVALDDFGTGYSALGALRHYSVDMIKIDRDFTARLDTEDGRQLVHALLKIARIYGAAVVAEGVETAQQRDMLRKAGCDFGQGYLFARPMDGSFFGAYALTHLVEDARIA